MGLELLLIHARFRAVFGFLIIWVVFSLKVKHVRKNQFRNESPGLWLIFWIWVLRNVGYLLLKLIWDMVSIDADMLDVNVLMVVLTPDVFDRLELIVWAVVFGTIWNF